MPLRNKTHFSSLGQSYSINMRPKVMNPKFTPVLHNPASYFQGSKPLNCNFNSSKDKDACNRYKKLQKPFTLHFYFHNEVDRADDPLIIKAKGSISLKAIKDMLHSRLRFINVRHVVFYDYNSDEQLSDNLHVMDLITSKLTVPKIRVIYGDAELQETQSNNVVHPQAAPADEGGIYEYFDSIIQPNRPEYTVQPPFPQFASRQSQKETMAYILSDKTSSDDVKRERVINSFVKKNLGPNDNTTGSNSTPKMLGKTINTYFTQSSSSFRDNVNRGKCNAATMTDYSLNTNLPSSTECAGGQCTDNGSTLRAEETSYLLGNLSSSFSIMNVNNDLKTRKLKIHKPNSR